MQIGLDNLSGCPVLAESREGVQMENTIKVRCNHGTLTIGYHFGGNCYMAEHYIDNHIFTEIYRSTKKELVLACDKMTVSDVSNMVDRLPELQGNSHRFADYETPGYTALKKQPAIALKY